MFWTSINAAWMTTARKKSSCAVIDANSWFTSMQLGSAAKRGFVKTVTTAEMKSTQLERNFMTENTPINTTGVAIFEPKSLGEGMKLAEMMASSDLVPPAYKGKAGNVIIAMQMGYEVGLKPMQAIQNISVINGRPCIWGDALLAIVQGSGKLKYIKEWEEGDVSYCETQRDGYPEPYRNSFSDADAKAAGLLGKAGPWQTNKRRMRQMRARSFNLRDQFADVLKGLSVAEEVQDYPVNVTPVVQRPQVQLPKRKSEVLGKGPLEVAQEAVSELVAENTPAPNLANGMTAKEAIEAMVDPFIESVKGLQQEAREKNEVISEAQQKRLFAMASSHDVPVELLKLHLKELGYNSSKEIRKIDYEKICTWVETVTDLDSKLDPSNFDEVEG